MRTAKRSIIVSSPKLYRVERNPLVQQLKEFQASGITVAVHTANDDEQSALLRSAGLDVIVVPHLSLCSCIIDKRTVWYGSVNILGYPSSDDNIIRLTDARLAEELLDVLLTTPEWR